MTRDLTATSDAFVRAEQTMEAYRELAKAAIAYVIAERAALRAELSPRALRASDRRSLAEQDLKTQARALVKMLERTAA